jgi:hypothetical protein
MELADAEMNRKLNHAQEHSIELLFAAEQLAVAKRKKFYARIFVVGLVTAFGTVFTPFFWGYPLTTLALGLVWFAAVAFYTLGRAIPISYGSDADIRWHVNPWRDALDALASEDRQIQAIVLLASFPICRIISKGIAMALR